MRYLYTHKETKATTGYFTCQPDPEPILKEALDALRASPLDEFMHRHILHIMLRKPVAELLKLIPEPLEDDPVLAALLLECALLNPILSELFKRLRGCLQIKANFETLSAHTPLPYITGSQLSDLREHREAAARFAANIHGHHPLPHPDDEDIPLLYSAESGGVHIFGIAEACASLAKKNAEAETNNIETAMPRPDAREVAELALQRLSEAGIIAGPEMRHEASLSPIALQRAWKIDINIKNGRLNYTLEGTANVYGRGLSLPGARASYSMEMVERASAYACVDNLKLPMLAEGGELIRASHADLERDGLAAMPPDSLPLDVPYKGQTLHWVWGTEAGTERKVLVPAQFVFLFWNVDEVSLLMSPGSTGLASGSSMAGAKVSALCEIVERDAEATMPYRRSRCFTLTAEDERIKALLDDYARLGIQVRFQNLTNFGIPCYQSFVIGRKGTLFKATGAGLAGPSALISALTETPYPYPGGGASAAALTGLPRVNLEDLPDYSTSSPKKDLKLLEEIFLGNGIRPIYINITRKDLNLPVVRALAPGLETGAEFDSFSRIRPRLFRNYLSGK